MLTDTVKYWLAVAAIMLVMWGYSGSISTMLIFGVAAVGAFIYWRITAQRKKRALKAARNGQDRVQERPRGA
jgi:flagellar biosynthesis component FlhA